MEEPYFGSNELSSLNIREVTERLEDFVRQNPTIANNIINSNPKLRMQLANQELAKVVNRLEEKRQK